MEMPATGLPAPKALVGHAIDLIGAGIDFFGVAVIVTGIMWASARFIAMCGEEQVYGLYKTRIGRSLLLGLELLVAADIVNTIAVEPSFTSLGVLAGLVLVRSFLGWTLSLEVEGRWPWQHGESGGAIRSIPDSAIKRR